MKTTLLTAVVMVATAAHGDTIIKNQGVTKGPITSLNCVGSRVTCSRSGSAGTITVTPCSTCDGGTLSDGGCGNCYPPPVELCSAWDAGDRAGGWWCLKGDQTMLSGSALTVYGNNSIPAAESWPVLPDGTLETMTRLNDISGGRANWNQFFSTDGGQDAPTGSFTTCAVMSNMIRDQTDLTNYSNAFVRFGSAGAIKWADISGTFANGDNVICKNGVANNCAAVNNLTGVPRRTQAMHCGVFTAGDGGTGSGSTASCTYIPGVGTTCVSTAHQYPRIGTAGSLDSWYVGLSQSGTGSAEMADAWFRGAFMTEKALSTADLNRIGAANTPGAQTGMTFARITDKTCCNSSNQCVNLPPNVPCETNCYAQVSPYQVGNTAGTPEATMTLSGVSTATDGGSILPVATIENLASPFGFKTAIKYLFPATQVTSSDAGVPYSWSESRATACQSGIIGIVRCSWYVYGPATLDMCLNSTPPSATNPLGQTCAVCTPGAAWTLCSVTGYATGSTDPCIIGNLTQSAPSNSQPNNGTGLPTGVHVVRGDATAWITMVQCNNVSAETDYSFLGTSNLRSPETCSGVGCP